jgi:hypothetical protein
MLYEMAMQPNLSKSSHQPFAGILLAFSLFGSFHLHHLAYTNGRGDTKIAHFNQIQQSNDALLYDPPRSPGFNELTGG